MYTDWQRAYTRTLARLILVCGLTSFASALTPAQNQESAPIPSRLMSAQPAPISQEAPAQLAGVEADKIVRWTLKDAILAALEKNPDIEIARQNVRLSQFDILAAQGVYDPLTSSTLNYNSQKTPNVSRFSGSSQNFVQNDTFGSALETGRQLNSLLRKQLQTIETDVRTAYHGVEAARLRYGAARAAREFAERQLTGEQEKFSVGLSTTFLVLTRQNDLSQARGAEAQALTDYNKAIAALQSAISMTLTENGLEIQSGKDESIEKERK